MRVIATFNLKGGVGKTATAVNLGYLASESGLRTLVWDLDAQGAASFYLRTKPGLGGGAAKLLEKKKNLSRAIRSTDYPRLDLVPSDFSYRNIDLELAAHDKPQVRLRKLLRIIKSDYDLVILDCAPSMSLLSENVFHMSDVLLVPLIPTHLSIRAFEQLSAFRDGQLDDSNARLLPFFSMVDRRKKLHRHLVTCFAREHEEILRTYIPYTTHVEQMGEHRAPVNTFADNTPGGRAFRALWAAVAARLKLAKGVSR